MPQRCLSRLTNGRPHFPVAMMAFVNRRPDLLILDQDGVLGHYQMEEAIRANQAAEGRDVIDFDIQIDKIWGLTGGKRCSLRLPEEDSCTILTVDLVNNQVIGEAIGLHPGAKVDPENGTIIEPVRAAAVLERDIHGREIRVLRALPGNQWIAFSDRGILSASDGAGRAIR